MGFKRPFDDEEFQDLPFKQARQVDYSNKLTQFSETGAHSNVPLKPDIADDYGSSFVKPQWHETFENDKVIEVSNLAKDSDSSAPLSLVTSSSSDEDYASGTAAYSSLSPDYFQFEFPWKTSMPLEDVYSSYLDDFPRKQVPLGPNHQASIPLWDRHMKKDKLVEFFNPNGSSLSEPDHHIYDNEEKLVGTCIIPMPDTKLSLCSRYEAGCGRSDCGCLDEGSVRCVRQHIMEAREELIKSIGHEKCVNLGFYDMGEEVACKWTEEEEHVFHEVVYSRPASLGQNFWKHLAQVFPDKTTKEIVSYYFNVFMLRKRAAQNRSNLLDTDSDDDELPLIHRGSYIQVVEEDEDSDLESPVDQYDHADLGEDILEDDDNNDDDGGGCFDGDLGDGSGDTTGEGSGIDHASEAIDMNGIDPVAKHMDKNAGSDGVDFTVQDDSCMSFEFQADKVDPCAPGDTRAALHVNRGTSDHSKCLPSEVDGCDDDADQVYLLDPCDTKVWDGRYLSPIRGVDLLPTSNIIEEIFGQGACEDLTRDVNSIG